MKRARKGILSHSEQYSWFLKKSSNCKLYIIINDRKILIALTGCLNRRDDSWYSVFSIAHIFSSQLLQQEHDIDYTRYCKRSIYTEIQKAIKIWADAHFNRMLVIRTLCRFIDWKHIFSDINLFSLEVHKFNWIAYNVNEWMNRRREIGVSTTTIKQLNMEFSGNYRISFINSWDSMRIWRRKKIFLIDWIEIKTKIEIFVHIIHSTRYETILMINFFYFASNNGFSVSPKTFFW